MCAIKYRHALAAVAVLLLVNPLCPAHGKGPAGGDVRSILGLEWSKVTLDSVLTSWPSNLETTVALDATTGECRDTIFLKELRDVSGGSCLDCVWLEFSRSARRLKGVFIYKTKPDRASTMAALRDYEAAMKVPTDVRISSRIRADAALVDFEDSAFWTDEAGGHRAYTIRVQTRDRDELTLTLIHTRGE